MARYIQHIHLKKPDDFVYFIMNDYLQKNEFIMSDWKGEPAYRAGNPMTDGYRYLKWSYQDGFFHLEAWLKGSFGGEWNLEGYTAILVKKPYRESLEALIRVLQQEIPAPQPVGAQNMAGMQGNVPNNGAWNNQYSNMPGQQVIPVQTVDNHKAATGALTMGILSLVFCWIPIVAIVLGCLGISRARMGSGSSKDGAAKTGKICSIIGISLGVILWVFNFMYSMMGIWY